MIQPIRSSWNIYDTSKWHNLIDPIEQREKIMLFKDANTLNNLHPTMCQVVTSYVLARCYPLDRHVIVTNYTGFRN